MTTTPLEDMMVRKAPRTEVWNAYEILNGKLEGRHRSRRENNIKMYLKETECEVVDWMYPTQDRANGRLLWTRNETLGPIKGTEILNRVTISFF
jgi:uncharacterized membrane-anchored protein